MTEKSFDRKHLGCSVTLTELYMTDASVVVENPEFFDIGENALVESVDTDDSELFQIADVEEGRLFFTMCATARYKPGSIIYAEHPKPPGHVPNRVKDPKLARFPDRAFNIYVGKART